MKRIICLLLTFVFFLPCLVFSAEYVDVSGTEYEEDIELLSVIGLVSAFNANEFIPEKAVSRAEFCETVMKIVGAVKSDRVYYKDVPEDHSAFDAISYAYAGGIMIGYGNGIFMPDKEITLGEAVKTLLTLMNYGYKYDGSIGGAMAAARQLKILKGISGAGNESLTRGEMCRLLRNALEVDLPVLTAIEGKGAVYEVSPDKTLLTEYLNMNMGEGLVEANELISIKNKPLALPGQIVVDGVPFSIRSLKDMDMLGKKVLFVYKMTQDENEPKEIVFIKERETKELEVERDNYLSFKENVFTYEIDEKEKKLKLSSKADIFYNGEAMVFSSDMFENVVHGKFKFLSTDGSSTYDIVFIEEYETYIAGNIRESEKTIRDYENPGRKLDLSDENIIIAIYKADRSPGTFADIKKKNILSVCANENIIKVYINDNIITDKLISTTEKGFAGEKGEYILSPYSEHKREYIVLNTEYSLYSDCLGKICYIENAVDKDNEYIYIVKAADGDAVGGKPLLIKAFHWKDGMNTYEVSETLLINDVAYKSITMDKLSEVIGITETYTDADGNEATRTEIEQLVTAEFEENGRLKKIYTAKPLAETEGTEYNGLTLLTEPEKSYMYYSEDPLGAHFGYVVYLQGSAPVIMVPVSENATDDDYETADSSRFNNFASYPIRAYAPSPDAEYAEILVSKKIGEKVGENSKIATVKKLVSTVDENGEPVDKLYTLSENAEKTVLVEKNSEIIYEYGDKIYKLSDLSPGDTIVYAADADGFISSFAVIYDASEERYMSPATNDETNTKLGDRFVMTEITGITDNFYKVRRMSDGAEFKVALRKFIGYTVLNKNSSGFIVQTGDRNSADIGDKLLIQYVSRLPHNVVLIK